MRNDQLEHALALADELLADIELERMPIGSLVLKGSRLARLMVDDDAKAWLELELGGYSKIPLEQLHLIDETGRREDDAKFWPYPAAQIDKVISAHEAQLSALQLPALSGEMILVATRETRQAQAEVRSTITKFAGIRARIISKLHGFAARHYYELQFSSYQAELFDDARRQIDEILAPLSSGALDKVDSIYRRLAEEDSEAISQALNTCRRLIDSVTNELFPPTDENRVRDGNEIKLTAQHTQNRLNAFVEDHTSSHSRRQKIRRALSDIYDRVSTGVHSDVSADEAKYLFLNTYILLGEVLTLRNDDPRGELA